MKVSFEFCTLTSVSKITGQKQQALFANNKSASSVTSKVKALYSKYDHGKMSDKAFLSEIENVSLGVI
jgi:hypothetical protein